MKIKTTFSDLITVGDIKAVKNYAKEQKPELESIARESIKAAEECLNIRFLGEPMSVEATYYNIWEMPVISICGPAIDNNVKCDEPGHWLFVEAYKTPDEPGCSASIYRREA